MEPPHLGWRPVWPASRDVHLGTSLLNPPPVPDTLAVSTRQLPHSSSQTLTAQRGSWCSLHTFITFLLSGERPGTSENKAPALPSLCLPCCSVALQAAVLRLGDRVLYVYRHCDQPPPHRLSPGELENQDLCRPVIRRFRGPRGCLV